MYVTNDCYIDQQIYGATAIKSGRVITWKVMTVEAMGLDEVSEKWVLMRNTNLLYFARPCEQKLKSIMHTSTMTKCKKFT